MFESFKSFVSDFVDGEKHPSQFADNDYLCVPKIRFGNIGGEVHRRPAVK
jgi:hypothetical protein